MDEARIRKMVAKNTFKLERHTHAPELNKLHFKKHWEPFPCHGCTSIGDAQNQVVKEMMKTGILQVEGQY